MRLKVFYTDSIIGINHHFPLKTSYKIARIIKEIFLGEPYRTEPQNLSSLKYYQGHQQYFQIKGDLCTFHPTVPGILGSMEVRNK